MEKSNIEKLNEYFDYTISLCSSDLLDKDDNVILYNVYEEFDSCSWSYLHVDTLNLLLDVGVIDQTIFDLSLSLRELSIRLFNSDLDRTVEELKRNSEWQKVFDLCDAIIKLKRELRT